MPSVGLVPGLFERLALHHQHGNWGHAIELIAPPQTAPIEAEQLLSRYGVRVYERRLLAGKRDADGCMPFSLRISTGQRRWAEYLLLTNGWAIRGSVLAENRQYVGTPHPRKPARRWSKKRARSGTLQDRLIQFLEWMMGSGK